MAFSFRFGVDAAHHFLALRHITGGTVKVGRVSHLRTGKAWTRLP